VTTERLLAIGSYTSATGGAGAGITQVLAAADGGSLEIVSVTAAPSPSFLLWSGDILYSAEETSPGFVSAYRRDQDGALVLLGTVASGGDRPCHLALHPSGRYLAVSNYGSGSFTVLEVLPDGSLGRTSGSIQHSGRGVHATRQDRPHPHTVAFSRDGRWAILLDGGLDTLSVHGFDPGTGALSPAPSRVVGCARGAGPRHAAWISESRLAVVEEISGTVSTFDWSPAGRLSGPIGTSPSSSRADPGAWPSEIQPVAPSTLLVANRREGLLTVHDVVAGAPIPRRDLRLPSPNIRHFWASGDVAFVALQDSNQLVSLDLRSGAILGSVGIGSPAFVAPRSVTPVGARSYS
jgi:6-phosphogluconolactonase